MRTVAIVLTLIWCIPASADLTDDLVYLSVPAVSDLAPQGLTVVVEATP